MAEALMIVIASAGNYGGSKAGWAKHRRAYGIADGHDPCADTIQRHFLASFQAALLS